jgi:uncharacterized integral membrane protein
MNNPVTVTTLSKSILAGLLSGVIAALINLCYVIIYRETTGFSGDDIFVMPLTIFFGFPILLLLGGMCYFLIQKHMPNGMIWFSILCLTLMTALAVFVIQDTRYHHGTLLSGPRGLFLGLVIITFLLAAFLIPYFARHSKIYE